MQVEEGLILLVEDDPGDVTFFERALREAGFGNPLEKVHKAEQAQRYLEGNAEFSDRQKFPFPKLVVLDLTLPDVNGLELLRWMRQRQETAELPVVILDGRGGPEEIAEAKRLQASAYHAKPNDPDELRSLVSRMMDFWIVGGWMRKKTSQRNMGC
jgi:CheY-like chemotaxis protein